MDNALATVLFAQGRTVAGVKLAESYTFAHAAILEISNSPYAVPRDRIGVDDIVYALAVLSDPAPFPLRVPSYGYLKTWRLARKVKRFGLAKAHHLIIDYIAEHKASPMFYDSKSGSKVSSSPILYYVAKLMRQGRMGQREAWLTGFGYGVWLSIALSEAGGAQTNLISEQDKIDLKEAGHAGFD